MTSEERDELGIKSLPENIMDAVNSLRGSQLMKETLGNHIFDRFIRAKEMEWSEYNIQVHDWELNRYLLNY